MPVVLKGALIAAVLALAACATPRYQTVYRYEPPAGGQACVESCDQALRVCQDHCDQERQACLKTLGPEVEARYAEALRRYANDLNLYRLELERYRYNLWFDWHRGPWWYEPWWPPYYLPYPAPIPPNRERIAERLGQERCSSDCGCRKDYDACFSACGGRRIEETRCIANCPPE